MLPEVVTKFVLNSAIRKDHKILVRTQVQGQSAAQPDRIVDYSVTPRA